MQSNFMYWQKTLNLKKQNKENSTAPNERFGASGGVARQTLCVEQPLPLSSKPQ